MEEYELFEKFREILEASIKRYAEKGNRNKEELLEKHKKILEIKAKEYTWKGNRKGNPDYEYWLNEGRSILLREFWANPFITAEEVKKALNRWLRDTERKLFERPRDRETSYGVDPGSFLDWEEGNPQTKAQKAHYEMVKERAEKESRFTELLNALERLDEREKEIIELYFSYGCKEKEIAEQYNISIAMVSKIKKRAQEKIKKDLEGGGLDRGFFFPVGKKIKSG